MNNPICPICRTPLKSKQIHSFMVWNCENCRGVMANSGVLRKYLGNEVVDDFWRQANINHASSAKKCPTCPRKLEEFIVKLSEEDIALDLCRNCQLIWFDGGELDLFPKIPINDLPSDIKQRMAVEKIKWSKQKRELEQPRYTGVFVLDFLDYVLKLLD